MKTVLITGGSSGIGLELSKKFIKDGYHLFWVSLEEQELAKEKAELSNLYPAAKIETLALDLTRSESQEQVLDWFYSLASRIDVFVNNAGFGVYGYSTATPLDKELSMLQLNVINAYKLAKLFLHRMTAQEHGTIINICSNSAFQPIPRMAVYAASKSFLSSYSQALNEELRQQRSKVKVITVYPSAIRDTPFKVRSNMEAVRTFEGLVATTKREVADDVWKGFKKNKSRVYTGAKHRNTRWLNKILPWSVLQWLITLELNEKS